MTFEAVILVMWSVVNNTAVPTASFFYPEAGRTAMENCRIMLAHEVQAKRFVAFSACTPVTPAKIDYSGRP